MIDFQNPATQAIIQSIGTIVTAVATAALTWLTARYVRLTGALLEEARISRGPNVYVDLELCSQGYFKLVVGNSGASSAHNLRFEVNDSFPWDEVKGASSGLKGVDIINNGISYVAPGRELKYEVGSVDWRRMTDSGVVELAVTYLDNTGKSERFMMKIHIGQYSSVLFESFTKPETEIAKAIEEAERSRRDAGHRIYRWLQK